MTDDIKRDWVENYGFILVSFAHMTDWSLADSEINVIKNKLQLMLSKSDKKYSDEEVSQKFVKILKKS